LHTVINGIQLFLLLGLGVTFFLGLGWLIVGYLLHGSLTIKKRNTSILQEIALALTSGLIINYGIVICFQSFKVGLVVGGILSVFGISCFAVYLYRYHIHQVLTTTLINMGIGMLFVCLLFLSPIATEPLIEWDARSIWFFHAKMIYAAGSFGLLAGWQHPSVLFSHTDYTNLVPVVAAQIAYVMGFWNEYLPKIALMFMLVVGITWLFTFARRSFSFLILLLLIPFSFFPLIWNGYMDGYLALYFSIALLLLGRYIHSSQTIDLLSSVCCLVFLLYLKNEGILAALIGLSLIFAVRLLKNRSFPIKNVFKTNWKYYLAGFIVLLPFAVWLFYKHQWNLSNDLGIGTTESFTRISRRLSDGSYLLILQDLRVQIEGALLLFSLLYTASIAWRKPLIKESLPAIVAAGIYCAGMAGIYLLTPLELKHHLLTSASRTMLSVNGCIYVGCYFILNSIEHDGEWKAK